jgi:hypothetical protein
MGSLYGKTSQSILNNTFLPAFPNEYFIDIIGQRAANHSRGTLGCRG